jgi:hypothetical protein
MGEIPGYSRGTGNFLDFARNGRLGREKGGANQSLAGQFP